MSYKALIRDSFFYIPSKILPAATTILFISFLYRNIEPTAFVNYSVAIAISLISTQLSSGWVANSILFHFPNAKNHSDFLIRAIFITVLTSILGILIGVSVILWNGATAQVVIAAVFLMIGQSGFYVLSSIFQSRRNILGQLKAVTLQCSFQVIALFVLFKYDYGSDACAIFAYGTGFFIACFYYLVIIFPEFRLNERKNFSSLCSFNSTDIKNIIGYGLPLGLWTFSILLANSSDRFFLKHIEDVANAASYVSAKDLLVGAAGLVTMPLLMASHPIILKLARDAKWSDAENIIKNNIQILVLLFSVYLTSIQFVGLFLLKLMFGMKYSIDIDILLVMLFGLLFSCVSMYAQKNLEALGKTILMAGLAAIVAVLCIAMSALIIPRFGAMGAAWCFVASNFLYLVLVVRSARVSIKTLLRAGNFIPPVLVWILGYGIDTFIRHSELFKDWDSVFKNFAWISLFTVLIGAVMYFYYRAFYLRAK